MKRLVYEEPIKILIIEDEEQLAILFKTILLNNDLFDSKIEISMSLEDGINKYKSFNPDIILLDLVLPDSTNPEGTFVTLHKTCPDANIIILTGIHDRILAVKLIKDGAKDFLYKGTMSLEILPRSICFTLERERANRLANKIV